LNKDIWFDGYFGHAVPLPSPIAAQSRETARHANSIRVFVT
jgi:hypothetical protein